MAKTKNTKKPTDYTAGENSSGSGNKVDPKPNSGIAAVLDKDTKNLPNLIWSFRNGRRDSVGYDEPTYFGFGIDIHSQTAESSQIYNPYTGLRANPLFYQPEWAKLKADGGGIMEKNDSDTKFPELTASPSEACAIQYLSSYSLPLDQTKDYLSAKGPLLKTNADDLISDKLTQEYGGVSNLTRGYYLMEFIKTLNYIQEKTPWSFKEIDGINNLWKATQPTYDFKPIELVITADETVDLRITKLADSYRMATYDSFNHRKVIAPNLEKFSMDIYIMDMRFIKDEIGSNSLFSFGTGSSIYDNTFSAQVNFGGIAFRCMGCRFDFSGYLDQTTSFKPSTPDAGFQPKFKIIIDRVIPATYFGDKSFGSLSFAEEFGQSGGFLGNALDGALDLGPFTGGVTRILSAGRRELGNLLGKPQRWINDQLGEVTRKFDEATGKFLDENLPLSSRPFEKKDVESIINERKVGGTISTDIFPGRDNRKKPPLTVDVFPGVDTRKANPIKRDVFPGADDRTADPIKSDVFPGTSTQANGKINRDVFPGDVPILKTINQRKVGGKITSQNPYKP